MLKVYLLLTLLFWSCSSGDPQQPIEPQPPEPSIPTEPSEPVESIDHLEIAKEVDAYYNSNQLLKDRSGTTFADSIYKAVKESMESERSIPLGSYVKDIYGISSDKPVSLKEPLCKYSNSMAQRLLRTSISSSGVDLVNRFVTEVNAADEKGKTQLYSKFMMCLSYSESLGDPDTSRSYTIASQEGVEKASGVKYYFDSLQTNPDSQINIGLYQFSPIRTGNIFPCIKEFGPESTSRKSLVETIGAQDQLWNARCGVHKLLTLFYVSKNTNQSKRKAGDSCVSLHNRNAYNHFGPLQREGNPGGGFTKLYECVFSK